MKPKTLHPTYMILTCMGVALAFWAMAVCVGCGRIRAWQQRDSTAVDTLAQDSVIQANDISAQALAMADSTLRRMTLEQCIAQTIVPAIYARDDAETLRHTIEYGRIGVGGVVLLKGDLESAAVIADTLCRLTPGGSIIAVDAETGLNMRFKEAPAFPWNGALSRSVDEGEMYDYGRELARECRMVGINMVLGPVVDVVPQGHTYALMHKRSIGSDASRVARLGAAYARGLEDGGVISVAKHFPGHGSADADSHVSQAVISKDGNNLSLTDLFPFRVYIESGLSGVMVGHIYSPALDSIPRPAAFSPMVIQNLLRTEMGFDGLVLTDALSMGGAKGYNAADALAAGADIILAPLDTRREIENIKKALREGLLSEGVIRDRCRRILLHKYLLYIRRDTMQGKLSLTAADSTAASIRHTLTQ